MHFDIDRNKKIPEGFASWDEYNDAEKQLREENIEYMRYNPEHILSKAKNKGYICPICTSGTGDEGTGIEKIMNSRPPKFTCFAKHCFKDGGDILDIIAAKNGLDTRTQFIEVYKVACEEFGRDTEPTPLGTTPAKKKATLPLPANTETAAEPPKVQKDFSKYIEEAASHIEEPEPLAYLKSRGISLETAKRFNLGYDAQADPAESGYKEKRLIIPIETKTYIARALRKDINKGFKVMWPKGSKIELFNTSAAYTDGNLCFICEGWADALSFEEIGYNAMSINSTSNANKLVEMFKKKLPTSRLIIAMDNDGAGAAAVETLKNGFNELGLKFVQLKIPNYKDANEALSDNREGFISMVKKFEEKANEIDFTPTPKEPAPQEAPENDYKRMLEKFKSNAFKPYATGLKWFDDLIGGGMQKQSVLLLLASPGTGKTTLCQQIAHAIAKSQRKVVYLSLEMSEEQMIAKGLSGYLYQEKKKELTAATIMRGYAWTPEQEAVITEAFEEYEAGIGKYLLYKCDAINTIGYMKEFLEELGEKSKKNGEEAPLVIVDYLHYIQGKATTDQENIKEVMQTLKNEYALKYDGIVIGISAVNRNSMSDKIITLDSGRDSSNLEYTADYVLSLDYEYRYNDANKDTDDKAKRKNPRELVLKVLKSRMGELYKTQTVYFYSAYNTFDEWCKLEEKNKTAWSNAPTI